MLKCAFCEQEIEEAEAFVFDGEIICDDCRDNETKICDHCGKRIWKENAEGSEDITLCSNCYTYEYTYCESCGVLLHNDNAHYQNYGDIPYCESCFEDLEDEDDRIEDYNYKPEPIFYGSGPLYMGIELEIDKGGESGDNAEILMNIANANEYRIYCKHDGSLTSGGFEQVSHPMSLDYHQTVMPWREILEKAAAMGYRSHQTTTCGLHVHVNRSFFGPDEEVQEQAIARVVHFVEQCWNELLQFSRRTEAAMNRWASRYGIADTAQNTYKNAKEKHLGRYVAVNLENYHTIEFRMFRGTLRYDTFLATLQLVEEICQTAVRLSDKELERLSWSGFVSSIGKDKPELIDYLKSKRLYVNEAAPEGDEI